MKKQNIFISLFFAVFIFPFFGNISNTDALGNYGCGNPDRKTHVNCLRGLLDTTPYGLTVPKGKRGQGKYGCGQPNRRKHVNCLRRLLYEHGAHLAKRAGTMAPGTMAPDTMAPGTMPPGTMATGTDSPSSADCTQNPSDGWQAVTEVRSEADFQIGFTDAVAGRQYSKFDNDSSIVCVAGEIKDVYVGTGAGSSNLGMFIDPSMDCTLRNDNFPSGGRGVHKLICP